MAGGNGKQYISFGKELDCLRKGRSTLPYDPTFLLRHLFKRNKNKRLHKDLFLNVHSSTIHDSPKPETVHILITGEQINKILFSSNKKELRIGNMLQHG